LLANCRRKNWYFERDTMWLSSTHLSRDERRWLSSTILSRDAEEVSAFHSESAFIQNLRTWSSLREELAPWEAVGVAAGGCIMAAPAPRWRPPPCLRRLRRATALEAPPP